jgi:hypothetical protein
MKALKIIIPGVLLVIGITSQAPAQWAHDASGVQQIHLSHDEGLKITENIVRAAKVVDYGKPSGDTKADIVGTSLSPEARGVARIQQNQNHFEIEAEFDSLQSATRFGPEYLTYVLWAITSEGRVMNLGEVVLNGEKSKLNVTTALPNFALVVTAEPYFAVSQPSEIVVMENVFPRKLIGKGQDVKYELLPRETYTGNVSRSALKPIVVDPSTPLHLYEARNALWIALWAGADKDAAELFSKAERLLQRTEAFHASSAGVTSVLIAARETILAAENARVVALKRRFCSRISEEKAGRALFDNRRVTGKEGTCRELMN